MYLRNTEEMLLDSEQELKVREYCDASFQMDRDDSKSQSSWVFTLNGGGVTWKSSKQDTVAISTCESKYIAASEASKEATWIRNFTGDLGVVPNNEDPIEIFSDPKGAVILTKEPGNHGRSQNIKRKYHYICNVVEDGEIVVKRVSSGENPVDPFTKGLAHDRHSIHVNSIDMRNDVKF
jgi:hypothetical protein